jgi:uncharacterized membrane protein YdjX (TVP38/TMEM64 family)
MLGVLRREILGVPLHRWLLVLAAAIGLVVLSLLIRRRLDIEWSLESLRAFVDGLGVWGPLAFVGVLTFRFLFLIPTGLLLLAGGVLFGPVFGTLYGGLGMFLSGALKIAFVAIVGRRRIVASLPQRIRNWLESLTQARMSAWALGGVCAYPFFPKHVFQYAALLSGMALTRYLAAIFIGSQVQAYFFAHLGEAIYSRAGVAVSAGALIAAVVVPLAVPSWRRWMLAPLQSRPSEQAAR